MVVEHLKGPNLFTKVLDSLEGPVEGGVVPRALVLGARLLREPEEELLVIIPCGVNLLLNVNELCFHQIMLLKIVIRRFE